jgi:hypothetical protein
VPIQRKTAHGHEALSDPATSRGAGFTNREQA